MEPRVFQKLQTAVVEQPRGDGGVMTTEVAKQENDDNNSIRMARHGGVTTARRQHNTTKNTPIQILNHRY
ncbi:hypothetical protein V6N12_002870 [Hibiscus sabdariffa]|uniref:Uncharacterized protein n=1 Tax=Hibiscus sabdariffa TaxID=183260 RepID=A0ABR2EA98_9ROSI